MKKTQRSFNSTIRKSGRPKKTNPARRRKEWKRVYGSPERVEWVANEGCVIDSLCQGIRCENAHVRGDGAGRKADARFVVPMCELHHRILHKEGVVTFQKMYGVDLEKLAAQTEKRWLAASPIEEHTQMDDHK